MATAFFVILIIVTQFNGVMYYIDEKNLFHWGPMYWLPHVTVNFLYFLILWAVLWNGKKLGRRAALSYASYAVIPMDGKCGNRSLHCKISRSRSG